jgi:hypothetical protein
MATGITCVRCGRPAETAPSKLRVRRSRRTLGFVKRLNCERTDESSRPENVDDAIAMIRAQVESGETPPGLEGAKMLMLVNRENGKGVGVTLFESEDAMRRGDKALNAMNPGGAERRVSVEFFEVPVQTVT